MSRYAFVKEAGEKVIDLMTPGSDANEEFSRHLKKVGLSAPDVTAQAEGDTLYLRGEVATQEENEKVVLAAGNISGVAGVEDGITVTGPPAQAARFVTVEKGDTLSSIAKTVYGGADKHNAIFEANKPMLKKPDGIYPGQVLRVV
ncbi:peptidoglycan-binding protein LysM [Streptomyces sp. NPDC088135]|uniref:peptidoglycan-binding protein LysM n=1 Tax=Streptomyces sp. NPDC088135 TaxID=3160993 RepID=UPI003429C028